MKGRLAIRNYALGAILVAALMLTASGVAVSATYSITAATDMPSYTSGQTIKVTGTVSPAPGPNTAVFVKVINPSGKVVVPGYAPVDGTTGAYEFDSVAGGSADWTSGTYTVNATWGAYPPTIFHTTTFAYSAGTTSTTSSTSTSSTSSSSSSSISTSSSSSSTYIPPTSTTASSSSSSTSSTSSSTPSSSSGGSGIPEFPYQATFAGLLAAAVVTAYILARRTAKRGPAIPSPR